MRDIQWLTTRVWHVDGAWSLTYDVYARSLAPGWVDVIEEPGLRPYCVPRSPSGEHPPVEEADQVARGGVRRCETGTK